MEARNQAKGLLQCSRGEMMFTWSSVVGLEMDTRSMCYLLEVDATCPGGLSMGDEAENRLQNNS